MKKIYISFLFSIVVSISYSQTWRYINASGADIPWNDTNSWSADIIPTDGDMIGIWNPTLSIDLNTDFIAKIFENNAGRTVDLTIGGANTLTIDIAQDANATGISNKTTATTNLIFDGAVDIFNSTPSATVWRTTDIQISGNATNKITFGENSVLNLDGLAKQSVKLRADNSTQTFEFNGAIIGGVPLNINTDVTANFNSTSDNSGWLGALNVSAGANITVDSPTGKKFSSTKMTVVGTGAAVTLNNANVMAKEIVINNSHEFDLNINANQSLSHITMSGAATFNLNLGVGVTALNFWKNNGKDWGTSTLNINGYQEGVIKFGNNISPAGLTATQLSQITINGEEPSANPLSLDANGFLVGASDLVLGVKDHLAFEFSIYPNPAQDRISIQSQEQIKSIQLYDMLGRLVKEEKEVSNSVDISTLNTGFYMLKLETEDGLTATKKIIKK